MLSKKSIDSYLNNKPGTVLIVTDSNGLIKYINPNAELLLHLEVDDLTGKSVVDLFKDSDKITDIINAEKSCYRLKAEVIDPLLHLEVPVVLTCKVDKPERNEVKEYIFELLVNSKDNDLLSETFRANQIKIDPISNMLDSLGYIDNKVEEQRNQSIELLRKGLTFLKRDALSTIQGMNKTLKVNYEKIDFKDFVQQICDICQPVNDFGSITFIIDNKSEIPFYSDKILLSAVIQNLIMNSIKYRNQLLSFPTITVRLKDVNKHAYLIEVSDNGIGILPEQQEQLFDTNLVKGSTGHNTGSGMYVISSCINRLGGNIQVMSTKGISTSFTLFLPVKK